MNALEFFQTILPDGEGYYLALITKEGKVAHKYFNNFEAMAAAAEQYDNNPNVQLYHACGSFKQEFVEVDGKRKYRVSENWSKAKAFWIDVDCGEEKAAKSEGYATKKEAFAALKQFCASTSLPVPLIVDSGNGLHCYWVLDKAIPAASWVKIATLLKAVIGHFGFIADPTATADFARILRPVGARNKKGEYKTVVAKNLPNPIDARKFTELLLKVKQNNQLEVKQPKPQLNDDLTAHLAPPPNIPSYAEIVATKCGQVAEMRDSQGDVNYEHWRGVIGIIKHCEEGVELAHQWSARREETGHSQNDVDTKYDTWGSGPTTCEFFSKCNPTGCDGCDFRGKIKSPIMLGRKEPEQKATEAEVKLDGEKAVVQIPELPKGYGIENGQMNAYRKDKDDIMHAFPFCHNLFYPTHRIRRENSEFSIGIRMHLPDNRVRDFEIDTSVLASNQKTVEALAKYELIPNNAKDASMHMTAYLRDSLEKLKREAEELNTYTNFGWKHEYQAFLIGDRLYHRDGSVRRVLVGGYAKDMAAAFPTPKGSVESYSNALNKIYATDGMQPMQYAIASGFGSILSPLGDSMYKGLVMAITGEETAKGKTTVCWASLYAFGDADKMSLKTEDNATVNARYARMGAYRNIPLLIDELTNIDPEEFSKLAYTVSLGQERERLTIGKGTGTRFADSQNWSMAPYVTANKDLHAVLSVRQSNTQAEAVRMIQIKIDHYRLPSLSMSEVEAAKKQMEINKGCAGDLFLKYVVSNLDSVLERMAEWGKRLEQDVSDVKYRFYRSHAICSLTATEITNQLGITQFDLEKLYTFVIDLFHNLAASVTEQNTITAEDAFSRMLNELSPRIIVTTEYRDGRDGRGPEDANRIGNAAVAGRYIMGNSTTKGNEISGKLFLIRKEVTDWCLKHRVDYKTMMDAAINHGLAKELKDKFNVGRGTKISAGQHRCIEVDMLKFESQSTNAPRLTIHTGGKMEGSQISNE